MKQFIKKHSILVNLMALFVFAMLVKLTAGDSAYAALALPFVLGGVDTAPGHPDYEATGVNKNIPQNIRGRITAR